MDKKQKIIKFTDLFREWMESMTMHGFANIFRTKYIIVRIMWIICFLASTSFCFFIISRILINFFKFDVVTTIKVIEKDGLPFPAVTVCNVNPFVTEDGLNFVSDLLKKNNVSLNGIKTNDAYLNNDAKLFFLNNDGRFMASSISNSKSSDIRKNFSINFEKMFISCKFNLKPCDNNDWEWYYDFFYGNCYRFNTGRNSKEEKTQIKYSNEPGYIHGLNLELFIGIPNSPYTLSTTTGAIVFIDDNSYLPHYYKGIGIQPGSSSNLALERIEYQLEPKPYSDCVENLVSIDSFDSEYYKKVIRSNLTYRQIDCFDAYVISQIYKRCNCFHLANYLADDSYNFCDTIEEYFCALIEYVSLMNSNYKNNIKSMCPLECKTIKFGISKSEYRYPSASYASDLIKTKNIKTLFDNRSNITIEELRENILSVNVYYEFIRQTELKQSPTVTWDGLVGSIGGTLGLFLGISVLSFAEFIDLLFQIIFTKITNRKIKISVQ